MPPPPPPPPPKNLSPFIPRNGKRSQNQNVCFVIKCPLSFPEKRKKKKKKKTFWGRILWKNEKKLGKQSPQKKFVVVFFWGKITWDFWGGGKKMGAPNK